MLNRSGAVQHVAVGDVQPDVYGVPLAVPAQYRTAVVGLIYPPPPVPLELIGEQRTVRLGVRYRRDIDGVNVAPEYRVAGFAEHRPTIIIAV